MKKINIYLTICFILCTSCSDDSIKKNKIDSIKYSNEFDVKPYPHIDQYGFKFVFRESNDKINVTFFASENICFKKLNNYFNPSLDYSLYFKNHRKNSINLVINKDKIVDDNEYNKYTNCYEAGDIIFDMSFMKDILKDNPNYIGYINIVFVKKINKMKDLENRHQLFQLTAQVRPGALDSQ